MPTLSYEEARADVTAAMVPLAEYSQKAHATADITDPNQTGRLRHVAQVDALLEAVADYGAAAEADSAHAARYIALAKSNAVVAAEWQAAYEQERRSNRTISAEATMLYRLLLSFLSPAEIAARIPLPPAQ